MAFPSIANLSRPRLTQKFFGFDAVRVSNSVPLVVVPDPHPTEWIIGGDLILEFLAGGVAYSGALVYTCAYSGGGSTLLNLNSIAGNANMYQYGQLLSGELSANIGLAGDYTADVGKGIILTCGADRTLGTGTLVVTCIYRVKKLGL